MANAVVLEIKCWTSDETSRQSLLTVTPSFTSEVFLHQTRSIAAEGTLALTCGKKFMFVSATTPLTYAIDSGTEMVGSLIMLTFDNETHTLHLTAGATSSKITVIAVD